MSLTYGGIIEKVNRYLMPRPPGQIDLLAAYTAAQTVLYLDGGIPSWQAVRPGAVLGLDLEVFYVESVTYYSTLTVTPTVPATIGSTTKTFTWTAVGGTAETFTITTGTYSTLATLAAAIGAATGSVSGEAFSTKATVNVVGTQFVIEDIVDGQSSTTTGTVVAGAAITAGASNDSTATTGVLGSFVAGVQADVSYGFQGSTNTNHLVGALASVNPRFTKWDIAQAINDEILALDAPLVGVGQVQTINITYVPIYMGYDLGSNFDGQRSEVLEVSFQVVPPTKQYPLIRRGDYRVLRNQDTTLGDFPSGNGIIFYKTAWPGRPIRIQFLAPFTALVNLTDDAFSVGGIPVYMQDIIVMGAEIRLAPDREIQRNSTNAQPDPRKAIEVPPGAVRAATQSLEARYIKRLNEEKSRLTRSYPEREWR